MQKFMGPMLARLPDRVIARLLPARVSFSPGSLEALPVVPVAATRLYIGPANFAGQGWQWARAAERHSAGVGAISMATRTNDDFGFPVDYRVPVEEYVWSREWQRRQALWIRDNFTHVMVEAERALFSGPYRGSVAAEVRTMTASGISVAMLCHGGDIRLPSRHAALDVDSPFRDGLLTSTPTLERLARRNAALIEEVGRPVFVSTPDLLIDVPSATWLPVVVDPLRWRAATAPFASGGIPVVAHAPSQAVVKGSDLVDPVLRRLEREGIVRYLRVEGVPTGAMPDVYSGADIVLDQFRIGSYGVAACEAMASGRLVISHVNDEVRARVREVSGRELPILEATGSTLEEVLRTVIAASASFSEMARAGDKFVSEVHDGRLSARVLDGFLSSGG